MLSGSFRYYKAQFPQFPSISLKKSLKYKLYSLKNPQKYSKTLNFPQFPSKSVQISLKIPQFPSISLNFPQNPSKIPQLSNLRKILLVQEKIVSKILIMKVFKTLICLMNMSAYIVIKNILEKIIFKGILKYVKIKIQWKI